MFVLTQSSAPRLAALAAVVLTLIFIVPVDANRIQLGSATLEFSVPESVDAFDYLPIKCKLTGKGEITVQAVVTDNPAHERFFDSAIPNKVAYYLEYLSEEGNAAFKITNIGNTIWKANGYGRVTLADRLFPQVYIGSDMAPGDSITKSYPIHRIRHEGGGENERRVVLDVSRNDTVHRHQTRTQLETILPDNNPGQNAIARAELDPTPVLDDFEELGHAFVRHKLDGNTITFKLPVQTPAWADRLVVRLIEGGAMRSATVPLKVSQQLLHPAGKPNNRWTINGKPIFILVNVPTEEIPHLREWYGTDNIVLAIDWTYNPKSAWMKAVREHGYKIFPYSLLYVRLQMVSQMTGQPLMEGAPPEFNIQRVDALDPNFHNAMADVVDRLIETAGDVLFRTADGKIPICLSGEQSYGFPWASHYPTRWGGSTPSNVAAFRVWLQEKYGEIDKLNRHWKTSYKAFEEIDPTPITTINPPDYTDPWKEWGPAIEDFDIFRSKIHGEFWVRTVAEIKRRHPDVICGMNYVGDYASDDEIIYNGYFDWGVKDYQGRPVNWMARRTACLPKDQECFDFIESWNVGNPEGVRKNIEFWRSRGKEVVTLVCSRAKVIPGGDHEIRSHAALGISTKGMMVHDYGSSFFTMLKTAYEEGGVVGALNDPYIGTRISEQQRREIELFNRLVTSDD